MILKNFVDEAKNIHFGTHIARPGKTSERVSFGGIPLRLSQQ